MVQSVDVLVVGAGPIGIETAIALTSEGHEVLTVDAGAVGETIRRTFPPDTRFFTSPERLEIRGRAIQTVTQEKLTGEEYLAYLRALVADSRLSLRTYCAVRKIERDEVGFVVSLDERSGVRRSVHARHLVLATGGTDTPRRLGVPGEELPHVHHWLGQPHDFYGRRVMVVGGRNSAAESALRLYRIGADVCLSYRRPEIHPRVKFWIRPEVTSLIEEGAIVGYLPSTLRRIHPDRVELDDGAEVPVDDVLLQIGFEQDGTVFDLAGVALDRESGNRPVIDPATMQSSVPGIFVVGTATAGTQDAFTTFIENCHDHADRVAAALAGRPAPPPVPPRPLPEA